MSNINSGATVVGCPAVITGLFGGSKFFGDPNARFTAIDTSGGITTSRSNASALTVPAFIHVSASAIAGSGTVVDGNGNTIAGVALRPYERLLNSWNFNDASGTETLTDPFTGNVVNLNTTQTGSEAVSCWRTPGSYTITGTVTGQGAGGAILSSTWTKTFTVQSLATAGFTNYYYDSVNGSNANDGLTPSTPKQDIFSGTAGLSSAGVILGTNVAINLAYGSSWSKSSACITIGVNGPVRILAYTNQPSSAKPILGSHGSAGAVINFTAGANLSDVVVSNVDMEIEAANTNTSAHCVSIQRAGQGACMIQAAIASNTLTIASYTKGLFVLAAGRTLIDATGTVTGRTISSGSNFSWTVSAGVDVASEAMMALDLATPSCGYFTGSITSNVLNVPGSVTGLAIATGQHIIDFTGNVGSRTVGSNVDATHWNVSAGSDVASEVMVIGKPGSTWSDLYFDNCVMNNNAGSQGPYTAEDGTSVYTLEDLSLSYFTSLGGGGSAVTMGPSPNSLFDPKSACTNTSLYMCSVKSWTASGSTAPIEFGSINYMSFVGVTVDGFGAGDVTSHMINPEGAGDHYLCAYTTTKFSLTGPSNMDFAYQPRAVNMWNGTLNGDYVCSYHCVTNCKFGDATTGISLATQTNDNPSTTEGYFQNVVIQKCSIGPMTAGGITGTSWTTVTIRDCQFWGSSSCFIPSSSTSPKGLASWMPSNFYRNLCYRPATVTNVGEGSEQTASPMLSYFRNFDSSNQLQVVTDNIFFDNRANSNPPLVMATIFSAQNANLSVWARNQYWVPNITGGQTGTYFNDGVTAKTLAQWQAASTSSPKILDPDATYANPMWPNPDNGQFT